MKISILTLFPALYEAFRETSLIGRAVSKGLVSVDVHNLLSFCAPKERVDGPTYGHHAGMVIRPEVIERAFTAIAPQQPAEDGESPKRSLGKRPLRIFFSPRGTKLDQQYVRQLAQRALEAGQVIFCAARYEGIDARAEEEYADECISIGDYVLMGGDLPTQVCIEALVRYFPDFVGSAESVERDSFTGLFVDAPAYTAPAVWRGKEVPAVLRSGDHKRIEEWSLEQSVRETVTHHFEWLRSHECAGEEVTRVQRHIPPHYVALMHDEIALPHGRIGTTSVTSLDIHDIARSSRTYGMRGFFIVTPLVDQQKIVQTLLSFWKGGDGVEYNGDRSEALATTELVGSYQEVVAKITEAHGKEPLVIVTSAREIPGVSAITYREQEVVWEQERPVLLVLGTGRGLSSDFSERVADYALVPIYGYSDFNHLSVRSAAAIIFDRWLGQQPKKRV